MPKINRVLKRLITTEKTTKLKESQNKYVFEVALDATANRIAQEVEKAYRAEVTDIRVLVIPGKKRRLFRTHRFVRLPKWKKAIVTLKEGQKIEESKDKKSEDKVKESKSEGKENR